MVKQFSVETKVRGLHEITGKVAAYVAIEDGLCTVFVRHTSASLVIQENADPSARHDLERWLDRLVPDGDPFCLWEHRLRGSSREVVVHIAS